MRFTSFLLVVAPWLLVEPMLWPHRPEKAILAVLVGFLALAIGPAAVMVPRVRPALAVLGVSLALSNFVFPDRMATLVSHVTSGLLLAIAGLATAPRPAPVASVAPASAAPAVASAAAARGSMAASRAA